MKDAAGNAEANLAAKFSGATYVAGGVLQKFWDAINTNTPDTLRADPRFPDSPTSTTIEPRFEYPPNAANEAGSNYGDTLSGWLVPPKDGDYVFFICSDDMSDLFLSTDDNPANKKLIAQETVWSSPRQWAITSVERAISRPSAPINSRAASGRGRQPFISSRANATISKRSTPKAVAVII